MFCCPKAGLSEVASRSEACELEAQVDIPSEIYLDKHITMYTKVCVYLYIYASHIQYKYVMYIYNYI